MKKLIAIAVALAFSSAAFAQMPKDAPKGKRQPESKRVEDKSKPMKVKKEGKRKTEAQRTDKK